MFICNFKFNKTRFFKWILAIMAVVCICLAGVGIYRIYNSNNDFETFGGDCMPSSEIAYLTDENYTNVLQEVHENLETYIGQKICYTGYVYRVTDLQENEFVLARDMQLDSNSNQTVIVGFLCSLSNACDYDTYSWVTVTGTIEKGYYYGDIPCINIESIEEAEEPENCIVPAPDEYFIQTSVIY